jgi:hypothetical protein
LRIEKRPELMNIFSCFEAEFQTIISNLVATKQVVAGLDTSRVVFELPRDESHGDIATNAAMVLAKQAGKSPRDLASLSPIFWQLTCTMEKAKSGLESRSILNLSRPTRLAPYTPPTPAVR